MRTLLSLDVVSVCEEENNDPTVSLCMFLLKEVEQILCGGIE